MSSLLFLLAFNPAQAVTLEVNPNGCLLPGVACSISEALEVAVSGDTIQFTAVVPLADEDGYRDSVTVNGMEIAELTIESTMGAGAAIWRPLNETTPALRIVGGANVTVRGFTFQDSNENCVVSEYSTLNVEDSSFRYCNSTGQGGAIFMDGGTLSLMGSHFFQNYASSHGGAIYHEGADVDDALTIVNTVFEENGTSDVLSFGGAVSAVGVMDVYVASSDFLGNGASTRGGGLSVESGDSLVIDSSRFQNNGALQYEVEDEKKGDKGGLVTLLFAEGEGGGVYADVEQLEVMGNVFCSNVGDAGGGVFSDDVPSASFTNNVFVENMAVHYGGGVNTTVERAGGTAPALINNTFLGNSAGKLPSGSTVYYGGGASVALDGTLGDLRNNVFAWSTNGGAIFGNDGVNYTIGDPIAFEYNLYYQNCDQLGCEEHYTGDLASYAVSFTNISADPEVAIWGFDYDCYQDAFYPTLTSPVIDRGDPAIVDAISQRLLEDGTLIENRSDIGAYGGPGAHVVDRDGDTYENIFDCNDLDSEIHPNVEDVCDSIDNDCDGTIDEDTNSLWFPDLDLDGFGDAEVVIPEFDCEDRSLKGWAPNNWDCDDTRYDINPNEPEVCDNADNDCNGVVDDSESLLFETWTRDADGDGYGGAESGRTVDCTSPGKDWTLQDGDCDDTNPDIRPGAGEVCDGADNDCNNLVDDEPTEAAATWYLDADGDGVGAGDPVQQCEPPVDGLWSNYPGDCNDSDASTYPTVTGLDGVMIEGAEDVCDNLDNDCTGVADDDPTQQTAWYVDTDGDGLGDNTSVEFSCDELGDGYVTEGGDCDDSDAATGECAECGCQSTPGFGHMGLVSLCAALFLRRRRS